MQNCLAHTRNVYYNTDGGAYPCCQYDNSVPYTPADTEWHPGCHRCQHQEAVGMHSLRQTLNSDLIDQVSVEIAVDNICNLTCVMCSSFNSHGIARRERDLYGRSAVPGRTVNRIDPHSIDFSQVTRFRLYGGEPLYSPGMHQLIQSVDPENMEIILPTNCTIVPNTLWQSFLKRAASVTVDLSIDAWGDLNTYQRRGSDWATVVDTLDWWYNNTPYTLNINATVTVFTANAVDQLCAEIAQRYPSVHVHLETATSPPYLDINRLPGIATVYGINPNTDQDLYAYFYTYFRNVHVNTETLHSVNPVLAQYIDAHTVPTVSKQEMLQTVMPKAA